MSKKSSHPVEHLKRLNRIRMKPRPFEHLKRIRMNPTLVRSWRLGAGLSQRQAAKACRVAPRTWRRCEHGLEVEILTAARVAKKMRIPVDKIKNVLM
jgi:DNA-binding XRE family transcriptional regulator